MIELTNSADLAAHDKIEQLVCNYGISYVFDVIQDVCHKMADNGSTRSDLWNDLAKSITNFNHTTVSKFNIDSIGRTTNKE